MECHPMGARSAMCVANPRPMRGTSLPPLLVDHAAESVEYAQGHDDGMMSTMHALLAGLTGSEEQQRRAHLIASLPLRLGGHGLRSAVRTSTGAYWSSWADATHMVAVRLPTVARQILTSLDTDAPGGCLEELQEAARTLDRHSFVDRLSW